MQLWLRTVLFILLAWLQFSGTSFAKQVFFQDGSVLDCQSFWKHGQLVVVKVNRDVVLEFGPSEVNFARTFRRVPRAAQVQPTDHAAKKPVSSAVAATSTASPAGPGTAPGQEIKKVSPRAAAPTLVLKPAVANSARKSAVKPEIQPAAISAAKPEPGAAAGPALNPAAAEQVSPSPGAAAAPEAVPAAKEGAQSDPEPAAAPDPAAARAEMERQARENAQLIAEAIRKKDPDLLKKALEEQRNLLQQHAAAQKLGQATGQKVPPMKEPPWFKYLLMLGASALLIIASWWAIFKKAGESGLKSLVPIYNFYVLMEISGKPGWWSFLSLVPVLGLVTYFLAMLALSEKFGRSPVFGVGLVFLPMFFFPMLAFGGSQYGVRQETLEFTFVEVPPPA